MISKIGILSLLMTTSCVVLAALEPYFTPRELYGSPNLDGQRIAVRGFITNGRCIYQSRSRYFEFRRAMEENLDTFDPASFDEDAITILGPRSLLDNVERLRGTNVILHGIFRSDYLNGRVIDPHACGKAAVIIDEAELQNLVARPRRSTTR